MVGTIDITTHNISRQVSATHLNAKAIEEVLQGGFVVLWKVYPALTWIDDHPGSQNICLVALELLDEPEAEVH